MKIYRLDNPWGLFYLLIPLTCLVIILLSRFFFKKGVKITGVSFFERKLSISVMGYFISLFLILLGMFIISFSLTKPQYGIKKEKIVSEGIDIMIALDISESMLVRDFLRQSRIDGAKNMLSKFVEKRKGDRIGLVVFGESSILKCPGTLNINLLKKVIKNINIDITKNSVKRTAIGIGLASAVNRLLNLPVSQNNEINSKIIILVTDGRNNTGEISPQAAVEIAQRTDIKVYTIGIGHENEVDLTLLNYIANKTGGFFYHAKTSGELGPIFDKIDKIEKHKIETVEFSRFKNVGFKYAYLGIILLLIGLLSNTFLFKRLT